MQLMDCTTHVAKTKAQVSCTADMCLCFHNSKTVFHMTWPIMSPLVRFRRQFVFLHTSVCLYVLSVHQKMCLLYNLITVLDISLKLHTFVKHNVMHKNNNSCLYIFLNYSH